ncbi:MAG TPA: DUF664 domain-containing protein [Acidimicrobiales bacterium]
MAGPERHEWTAQQRQRIDELIDECRAALHDSLEGLSEEEVRRRLVPSKTTLLGLVKHANYVEGVWFDQAVTGRSYGEIGIPRRRSDEVVDGRGRRPVWAVQLQVLRELAQHAGHADILREQILASRPPSPPGVQS